MGLFENARKLATARASGKSTDLTWDGGRGWSVVRGKDGDDLPRDFNSYVMEGWRRNPVVRRCTMENATSVAEAPIRAFRRDDDGNFERIVGHAAEDLFVMPNQAHDGVGFIEKAVHQFLIGGNVFMEKRRLGSGVPFELHLHRPDRVTGVDVDPKTGIPIRWEVVTDAQMGTKTFVKARDMVHIPDTDPMNEIFGTPRLVSATLETDTDNKASSYVNEILGNFGSPGTVVSVDAAQVRNKIYLERAAEEWTEKFGPGRGRGKVAFLPGATRIQNVGFDLSELEFKDLRRVTRESICSVFGVDPGMIGLGSAAKGGTLSGAEHESIRRAFWEQTILPMMRRWAAALNAFLAPEFGENVWLLFDTSDVTALQPDRDADAARAVKLAEAGSFTKEEIRSEFGADPETDDDDIIVMRGTVKHTKAGELGETPEPPPGFGEDDEGEEEDDGDTGTDDGDEDEGEEEDEEMAAIVDGLNAWARPLDMLTNALDDWREKAGPVERAGRGTPFTLTGYVVKDKDAYPDAWKQFDEFARIQEPAYRSTADALFQIQRDELVRLARITFRDESKAITEESLDEFRRRMGDRFDRYHREWRRRYDVLMSQTVDVVAAGLAGATALSFDVFNPLVRQAVDERLNLIVGADQLTHDAIMAHVEDGFVEGLSSNELADRVREVFDQGVTVRLPTGKTRVLSAAERSTLIARTETTAVANRAAVALMKSTTDVPWVKLWLSQGDDRVRPEHQEEEADSENDPVPLDEPFRVTGLDAPGEPNCRCSVLFEQPAKV